MLWGLGSDQLVDKDRVIIVFHKAIKVNNPDIVGCSPWLSGGG